MTHDAPLEPGPSEPQDNVALAAAWRRLANLATAVAVMTSPALFIAFYRGNGWPFIWSLLATIFAVGAFRGLVDVIAHRMIPRAALYDADRELLDADIVGRRRLWFWRRFFHWLVWIAGILIALSLFLHLLHSSLPTLWHRVISTLPQMLGLFIQLPLFFLINFMILFGPMLVFGLKQMKGYEPGDADWGVKLSDVRGQAEPKQEVTRVISLWQSGDAFRQAGGKPERGLLFIGQPGTGKTMLSKAIATSFNSPIVTMPGSGFAQTFIGMDVIVVMFLIRKARKLARKWGGQCIIFIDEIDAVGLRRQALGGAAGMGMANGLPALGGPLDDAPMFGPWGSFTPSGDLVLETRAWRERMFAARAPQSPQIYPGVVGVIRDRINNVIPGGMMGGMGGGMALNQLLVQMDGVDDPPFLRKWFGNKTNTILDALYIVPQRIGKARLRLKPAKPRSEEIYFIGATNVPIDALDPALVRPGRMGRHIWFRTPTKDDRADIFDLYLAKVAHDPDLDTPERRDELARMTNGYSPAMIEQVCSMALTLAHSDQRPHFVREDIVEAMTTIESGTAVGVDYVEKETRAVAIHEAGHAVASHVYMSDTMSTRLSIRMRGNSLGHHQAIEKEERFSSWRHEEVGKLVWTLGAMAAEHVFYGENSVGVGGDIFSATWGAANMVGASGMGPEPVHLSPEVFPSEKKRKEAEERVMKRFETIGLQIMNRRSSPMQGDPIASVLSDPQKKQAAARILGQCYVTALACIRHNREAVAEIADILVRRRELYGDDVVGLLNAAQLEAPVIDVLDEGTWPKL